MIATTLTPRSRNVFGHFDRDDVAAAGGDDQGGIFRRQIEVSQDARGEAGNVFEEHGLALAVGADDRVVKREREFDDGVEAGEGAVTRPHFFDQDSAVAGAEEVNHSAGEDGLAEPVGGLFNGRALGADAVEDCGAFVEVVQGR